MANANAAAGVAQQSLQQTQGAFVGADSADTTNFRSMQALQGGTQGRAGANSGISQLQNLFSQGLQGLNQQSQRAVRPQIRVPLRLGFQPQPVSVASVRRFETSLTSLPGIRFIGPAEVVMEGRTAVLRGTVASDEDRRLAQALAMMEPEILAVKNELQVAPPTLAPAEVVPAAPAAP
jgi:hypothetical protein